MFTSFNISPAPSSLAPDALRRRLRDLAGDERNAQVEFLLHLSEFDGRKGFLEAGYDSLWRYCLQELHLREGPAARRIAAMRVLRQHSGLEAPLRDGRLCLSTVTLIAPLLSDLSLADVVARAAYRTKEEVEQLVASLRPRVAPRDGVRQLTPPRKLDGPASVQQQSLAQTHTPVSAPVAIPTFVPGESASEPSAAASSEGARHGATVSANASSSPAAALTVPQTAALAPSAGRWASAEAAAPNRPELSPVSAEQWSLRVTMDADMKADLETLKSLLSHTSGGDLTEVLREALRCAVEKHGKRRGAVAPKRERAPRAAAESKQPGSKQPASEQPASKQPASGQPASGQPGPNESESRVGSNASPNLRSIPASVRREVWARDQGCCAWRSKNGRRCGSRWKLELDHIKPVALGGTPTAGNLRLLCRSHNLLHAEQAFGSAYMRTFTTREAFNGRASILGSVDRPRRAAWGPGERSSGGAEALATASAAAATS